MEKLLNENDVSFDVSYFDPFTVVTAKLDETNAVGISKCMFLDSFDQEVGKKIALKRAMRTLNKKLSKIKITSKFSG